MYLVWAGTRLRGIYTDFDTARRVAIAVYGVSHITQQTIEYGAVYSPTRWWFF
jgi:hypothetical protein